MLPAAVAIAMLGLIGAFGSVRTAEAFVEGDICWVDTNVPHTFDDGQGNEIMAVGHGVTYGIVFRVAGDNDEGEDADNQGPNVTVRVDSETGSARITSMAEDLDGDDNVGHTLIQPGVSTITVDTFDPDDIDDADGNGLNAINAWLEDVGYDGFANNEDGELCKVPDADGPTGGCWADNPDYNGYNSEFIPRSCEDHWGFIDFECIEAGTFHIDIESPDDTEEQGMTLKFICGGQAERAEIAASPTTVETNPVGTSKSSSIITVTVFDQFDDRLEHAEVTFTTDNCTFGNTDPVGDNPVSPAGGGTTVTTFSDTDTTSDTTFLANNPLEISAGTAEVSLNCATGKAGVAHVTAIVQREGSDIVLKVDVTVIGATAASGLTLVLDPDEVECGEVIKATAKAVDSLGAPVSNGTLVFFTTDTSSGVVGGAEGAQGGVATSSGEASVLIATDPSNDGIHTVIAYTKDSFGGVLAQTSATYECEGAVAPAAPTVAPPATGTGTITPPSTGDAGLASGSTSATLFVIAGAVAFILAGLASVRFARN
jgi:hypothetical protein